MRVAAWCVPGIVALLVGGCGDKEECVPGETRACTCSGNASGAQLCLSTRLYNTCSCESGPDAPDISGQIFAANHGDTSIRVFGRSAGTLTPSRTIRGGNTGLGQPVAIDVDPVHGEIFVANAADDSITVYAITADGNAAPLRRIAGAATGLKIDDINSIYPGTRGLHVDTTHDEIVISAEENSASIRTFARTADGNVAPLRTIAGGNTTLTIESYGLYVDEVNNEILAFTGNPPVGHLAVFSRTADGDVGPVRTLDFNTWLYIDLAIDHANNELLVLQKNSGVSVYARTASGNATPLRMATSQGGLAMYFDPAHSEIGVAQQTAVSINRVTDGVTFAVANGLSDAWALAFAP